MTRLVLPADFRWELIIVDNGDTCEAARVVAQYEGRLPIRRIEEPALGLSHARNGGVREARGDYVCWIDDDVLVDPRWLAAYAEAFARHPESAIFGGRILPHLDPPTPRWFNECRNCWPITSITAQRDMGDNVIPLAQRSDRVPWGANFALRMEEQRRFLYDPALGVSPLQRRIGEESDVIYKIMVTGGTGWWVPDSKVRHRIPSSRQTLRHVLEYFRSFGETAAYQHEVAPNDNWNEVSGSPRYVRECFLKVWVRAIFFLELFLYEWLCQRTCSALRHWARFGVHLGVASYRVQRVRRRCAEPSQFPIQAGDLS